MPHQLRKRIEEVVHRDDDIVMIGPDAFCDLARIGQLAEVRFAVSHGKCLHGPGGRPLDDGRDGAGVDPAAEEHSNRHIAHQPRPDGVFQTGPAFRNPFVIGAACKLGRTRRIPKLLDLESGIASATHRESMARHQLANAGKHRLLAAVVAERQILGEKLFIEVRRDLRMLQQGLDFRSEGEQPPVPEVVERLDAQPVARAEEALVRLVPDREGKHSAEPANAFIAILFVGMQNRLGIATAVVAVSGALQLRPQVGMVEDLAVVGDPQRAVLVGHRLGAGSEVDDAQATVSESYSVIFVETISVRPAVGNDVSHPADRSRFRAASVRHYRSRDATHVSRAVRSRPARTPAREAGREAARCSAPADEAAAAVQ